MPKPLLWFHSDSIRLRAGDVFSINNTCCINMDVTTWSTKTDTFTISLITYLFNLRRSYANYSVKPKKTHDQATRRISEDEQTCSHKKQDKYVYVYIYLYIYIYIYIYIHHFHCYSGQLQRTLLSTRFCYEGHAYSHILFQCFVYTISALVLFRICHIKSAEGDAGWRWCTRIYVYIYTIPHYDRYLVSGGNCHVRVYTYIYISLPLLLRAAAKDISVTSPLRPACHSLSQNNGCAEWLDRREHRYCIPTLRESKWIA